MKIYQHTYPIPLEQVGKKAYNLAKLNHFLVPRWFCIPTTFFNDWLKDDMAEINQLLANGQESDIHTIHERIVNKPFLKEDIKNIQAFLNRHKRYAVRSSAVDEDHEKHSFAGIMQSFLHVRVDDIIEKIKCCYASAFSIGAIHYRKQYGMPLMNIQMAVMIQEMVKAEYSGVINTINPITNNPDEVLISVVKGLGEQLVSGKVDSTDYYVNAKQIMVTGNNLLPDKMVMNIAQFAKTVQTYDKHFQDIEFAIYKKRIYLLQSRDITTYSHIDLSKEKIMLDNANIIESYYGVTTPLTFSFAQDVYYKVYQKTLQVGKVNPKIIANLEATLQNLLYFYENKIYYNLNSWYHLNSIFPGKNSLHYMENMMGVRTKLTTIKKVKMNHLNLLKLIITLFHKLKNIDALSNTFVAKFDHNIMPYVGMNYQDMSNEDLYKLYQMIEENILNDFTTPIINDIGAMMYYGRLTKFVDKLSFDDKAGYIASLVGRQGNVESAQSAPLFLDIIQEIKANKTCFDDFMSLNARDLFEKYHLQGELGKKIQTYILKFGPRVIDELKLETITLIENPLFLYDMLKSYLLIEQPENTKEYQKYHCQIPLLKRHQFQTLLTKTKYFIKNRERLRLKRTYIYSVVRSIFIQIGVHFQHDGLLEQERDIFYLTKDEIFQFILHHEKKDFLSLVKNRKAELQVNQTKAVFNRIALFDKTVLPIYTMQEKSKQATSLYGIPSGVGLITEKVKLIENPLDGLISGEIILAYRTDPGWIPLFLLAKGLIVERGSILSHSAVVAREMGLPAVIGVQGATKIIKDGTTVTLDGMKGEVILDESLF